MSLGFLTAIAAAPAVAQQPPAAAAHPRPDIWVTYDAFGANNETTAPASDSGSVIVGVSDLRWPFFSIRIRNLPADRDLAAYVVTPAGFDRNRLQARPTSGFDASMDSHSRAYERAGQLQTVLNHYRPALTIAVGSRDRIDKGSSPELARHRRCARRLMREAIVEQIRTAGTPPLRRRAQEGLDDTRIARRLEPPIDVAALLLRLLLLPLPDDDAAWIAMQQLEERFAATREEGERPTQWTLRFAEAREHRRSVGRAIDLRAVRDTEQARICRSLPYNRLRDLRSDTCRVEAVIDRRDGWPIAISIVREGRAADDATEAQMRIFNRLVPLEGFVPPANPCA